MQRVLLALLVTLGLTLESTAYAQEAEKPRDASATVGFLMVPWGVAYIRAAVGASAEYKLPLIQQPGLLWNSTNVTLGVTNLYSFVSNTTAAYVEVTPIAFFKLRVFAGYDYFIVNPFEGGLSVLNDGGRQLLAAGQIQRGRDDSLDWVDGRDNLDHFHPAIAGGGMRLMAMPTLQAKFGPVGIQYNYSADFSFYGASGFGPDDIFYDSLNFTLRRMRDVIHTHELVVVSDVPVPGKEALLGVTAKYYRAGSTGLDSLGLYAMLFYRPDLPWPGPGSSPWVAAQAGTSFTDPMHRYDFSWIVALGLDWKVL